MKSLNLARSISLISKARLVIWMKQVSRDSVRYRNHARTFFMVKPKSVSFFHIDFLDTLSPRTRSSCC